MKNILTNFKDNTDIILINGDMEFDDSKALDDCILDILKKHPHPHVVINLSKCDYIDTQCLNELWHVYQLIKEADGELELCNLSDFCKEIINMTRTAKYLRIIYCESDYFEIINKYDDLPL